MEVNFKFEVGQIVFVRHDVRLWQSRYGHIEMASKTRGYESMGELHAKEQRPIGVRVIERHMQQCYGGIQLHYHLRTGGSIVSLTEPELAESFDAVDPGEGSDHGLTTRA